MYNLKIRPNEPYTFTVKANDDGSVQIYTAESGPTLYFIRVWGYFEFTATNKVFIGQTHHSKTINYS